MEHYYINELMDDHSVIEKALALLERQFAKEHKNWSNIKTLLDILWDYGELCHNMKEEKIYFPLLLNNGFPPQGPISVMLTEHEAERQYLSKILSLVRKEVKNDDDIQKLTQIIKEYSNLTKDHIWKENDILYPMGKKFVKNEDIPYLLNEFKRIEFESLGEGAYTRFKTLVDVMEKETGDRIDLLTSLPMDVINNMLDTLPVEITFVDAENRVRYFNKLDKEKIFSRSLSAVGRLVQQCHPPKSIHIVNKIIDEMRSGIRDKATFWINFNGMYLFIAYYAVRNEKGEYQGVVEMVQDVKPYRELEGEKRLLDED